VLAVASVVSGACAKQPSASHQSQVVLVPPCDTVPKSHPGVVARVPPVNTPTETGTLVGSVDERHTNLAVAGATVRIRGDANRDVNSDSAGGFVVADLKPGRYSVAVVRVGYDPEQDSVQVAAGDVVIRRYHLRYRACPL
jgi:hypothetical protein